MKFAFVIFRYFPFGGLQRDMAALARFCQQQGHSVTVFCERWQGESIPGVEVVEILGRKLFNIAGVKNFVEQFSGLFPRSEFDALIGFNKMPGLDMYFAGDTCFAQKALLERSWLYRLAPRTRLYLHYEAAVFGESSKTQILSLVESERKAYARFYATAPERFHSLPPGILPEHIACHDPTLARQLLRSELKLNDSTRIILCLGSGFHTKGVDISIATFAALQKEQTIDAALLIAGNDDPEKYRELAVRLGVAERVFFLGPRSPVGDLLHGADVLLHPARKELAGNVIVESILCACPVLVSDHCGFAHYVMEHEMGALIKPGARPDAIAEQLSELLNVKKEHWQQRAKILWESGQWFNRVEHALSAIKKVIQQKDSDFNGGQWCTDSEGEVIVLRDELIGYWKGQPVFDIAKNLAGSIAREFSDRQTLRFEVGGNAYYRKWHNGVGWIEIIKNLIRLRRPVLGARNEWVALNKMRALGIPGLIPVAFGERGKNPARQQSFIVTKELDGVIQLDHFFQRHEVEVVTKRRLIQKVASIARDLHQSGINHRDFYLCHFMLRVASLSNEPNSSPDITLMDLHRAQLRTRVPERWLVKDLGGLLFSSLNLNFSRRDYYRFLKYYFAADLRSLLGEHSSFLQKITYRARKTYLRDFGHMPLLR